MNFINIDGFDEKLVLQGSAEFIEQFRDTEINWSEELKKDPQINEILKKAKQAEEEFRQHKARVLAYWDN